IIEPKARKQKAAKADRYLQYIRKPKPIRDKFERIEAERCYQDFVAPSKCMRDEIRRNQPGKRTDRYCDRQPNTSQTSKTERCKERDRRNAIN
ncbi:MAG TPA: hypothetical protein VG309_00660, partial [Rhizomicrobium sp.]|nr:hypothetical protein [Rhizomicrobium sp.]